MRVASAVRIASLLVAFTCACSSKSENSSGSAEASKGGPALGTFTCKSIKDSACVDPTDRFEGTTEKIHMIYTTKELPKKGDVFLTRWIAEDVGEAAPANTVLATFESTVGELEKGIVSYTVEGNVKKPTMGWPKGSYRAEVLLGDKLVSTAKFKIE